MSTVQKTDRGYPRLKALHFFYYMAFWIPAMVSMYFAFTSAQHTVTTVYSDTVLHAFAFVLLTIALSLAHFRFSSAYLPAAYMLLYAIFIECVQYFLPARFFELADIGVDLAGIAAGLLVYRFCVARIANWLDTRIRSAD